MRHEASVKLIEHPIRKYIPADHNLSEDECYELAVTHLSSESIEDFLLIESDYNWPVTWTQSRRMLMMYACNSEFQLLQYLVGREHHCADRICHAVAGRHGV